MDTKEYQEVLKRKYSVSISLKEILAMKLMLTGGRLFTKDEDKKTVQDFFDRIGKKLKKLGYEPAMAEKIIKI